MLIVEAVVDMIDLTKTIDLQHCRFSERLFGSRGERLAPGRARVGARLLLFNPEAMVFLGPVHIDGPAPIASKAPSMPTEPM